MNILQIVSGGIAAYKAIDLTSQLVKQGHNVKVILTNNAKQFVTELPFQTLTKNKVYTDTFTELNEEEIQHIDLGKWADKIIVAPATANLISKFANGLADDLASSLMLAVKNFNKVFIFPAMNTAMYENPIIQENIKKLSRLGFNLIEPASGLLACGDVGKGKFPSTDTIISNVLFESNNEFLNKTVLITAGPTKEFIDPFRCFTNPSSGKMGIALANECAKRGAKVILVTGVDTKPQHPNIVVEKIVSTQDMYNVVKNNFLDCDIIIKAAAVSDYTPIEVFDKKVKKQDGDLSIKLKRTPDILKYVGENKRDNQISEKAYISEKANIGSYNIIIEDDVIIEADVTIYENVTIKKGAIIRSGSRIGGNGFEFSRFGDEVLSISFAGDVLIEENVEVQNNTCVDRGVFDRTYLGKNVKVDNLVHIAHDVKIGENTLVVACTLIGGRTKIGKNSYLGPNCTVKNGLILGENSKVSMGAVVTKNVKDNEVVTGNFAIPHDQFMKKI